MNNLMELLVASIKTFFALVGMTICYFLFVKGCPYLPADDIANATQGDYEILRFTQACMMTRPHNEYYLKHKDDYSDGFKRRNLIVETHEGFSVNVKWIDNDVIQVTSYKEGSIRKIRKSIWGKKVRLVKKYQRQEEH